MADSNHLAKLRQGAAAWNHWRQTAPKAKPDLADADLTKITDNLAGINLRSAVMRGANLNGINLAEADLYDCDLIGAFLVDVNLSGADIRGANFTDATVDGVRYDKAMRCLGARVDSCHGSPRFRRHVLELDYIESFRFEHPLLWYIWRATSDCSRSLGRTAIFGCAIILAFAIAYYIMPGSIHWVTLSATQQVTLATRVSRSIYYSIGTFTTLGKENAYPVGTAGEVLTIVEGILGYLFLGYLIAIFAQRTAARV